MILLPHNDGEMFSLNSISTDLATSSVELAADCFRMGKTSSDGYADLNFQFHYHRLKVPKKLPVL